MPTKSSMFTLACVFVPLALSATVAERGASNKQKVKCKYVVCKLYPQTDVIEGELDRSTFESNFKRGYDFVGERFSVSGKTVDGLLVATDGNSIVSLPIVHWTKTDGTLIFLCQGTSEPGEAPAFSLVSDGFESIVKGIKKELAKEE
jgi:hypothetical protein